MLESMHATSHDGMETMSEKQNCWQFMKCGYAPGGLIVDEFGICPASVEVSFDGVNDGDFAGRFC